MAEENLKPEGDGPPPAKAKPKATWRQGKAKPAKPEPAEAPADEAGSEKPRARSEAPSYGWRNDKPPEFQGVKKQARILFLGLAAVIVAAIAIVVLMQIRSAEKTDLYCCPFSAYTSTDWQAMPWLKYDAERISATLKSNIDTKNINLTKQKDTFLGAIKEYQHPRCVLYVAGRGLVHDQQVYLLPTDATPEDQKTWVSLKELMAEFAKNQAEHKLLLLDIAYPTASLYSGPLFNDVGTAVDNYFRNNKPAFPVITSCNKDEISQVMHILGRSVFGHYLLEALQGDANGFDGEPKDLYISVKELYSFLTTRVNRWTTQNMGVTQRPQLFGVDGSQGNFKVVHLRGQTAKVVETTPQQPPAPPPGKEEKLSAADKAEKDKKEAEEKRVIETARLRLVFPTALEDSWKRCDPWIALSLRPAALPLPGLIDEKEPALRLASLHQYEHQLNRLTTMLLRSRFGEPKAAEDAIPSDLITELPSVKDQSENTLDTIDRVLRRDGKVHTLLALWPRPWMRSRPTINSELDSAIRTILDAPIAPRTDKDKTEPSLDVTALLTIVKGGKDAADPEKSKGKTFATYHREALYYCWSALCTEENFSYEKLRRTEKIIDEVMKDLKSELLHAPCHEVKLMRFLLNQMKPGAKWDYANNPDKQKSCFKTVTHWLAAGYLAEKCVQSFRVEGYGFRTFQPSLHKLWAEQNALEADLWNDRDLDIREDVWIARGVKLEPLVKQYQPILDASDREHAITTAWWEAIAYLHALADTMVEADDTRWGKWKELADVTIELSTYLGKADGLDTATEAINRVNRSRANVQAAFANWAGELEVKADKSNADREVARQLELALRSGYLLAEERVRLYFKLLRLLKKMHDTTMTNQEQDQVGNTNTFGFEPLTTLNSERVQAERRRDINIRLLQLAGLPASTAKIADVTPADAAARQTAWKTLEQKLPTLLTASDFLAAARIEALLPTSKRADALLKYRQQNSIDYYRWLDSRQTALQPLWK